MTREQAMMKVQEGYQNLCNAENIALENGASVIDYCFKCERLAKLNHELQKRLQMFLQILQREAQQELDFGMDKSLLEDN